MQRLEHSYNAECGVLSLSLRYGSQLKYDTDHMRMAQVQKTIVGSRFICGAKPRIAQERSKVPERRCFDGSQLLMFEILPTISDGQ